MLDSNLFEDKAWEQMNNLLNEEMPEKKGILWWKNWLLLIPMLLLFIGLYIYWPTNDNSANSDNVSSSLVAVENVTSTTTIRESNVSSQEKFPLNEQQNNYPLIQSEKTNNNSITNTTAKTNYSTVNKSNQNSISIALASTIPNSLNTSKSIPLITDHSYNKFNKNVIEQPISNTQIAPVAVTNTKAFINELELNQNILTDKRNEQQTKMLSTSLVENLSLKEHSLPVLTVSSLSTLDFDINAVTGINYLTDYNSFSHFYGFSTQLSRKNSPWKFRIGVNYEFLNLDEITNILSTNSDLSVAENFPGGIMGSSSSLTISNVQQLSIPVTVAYNLNRFSFGLGVNNTILINETLKDSSADFNNVPNRVNTSGTINNVYRLGVLKTIDYRITNNFSTGLQFRYEFSDFNTGNIQRNNKLHSIGIQLKYKLY